MHNNSQQIKDIPVNLQKELSSYHKYVESRLNTIAEFDVWFEQTHPGKNVPVEWYNHINGKFSDK